MTRGIFPRFRQFDHDILKKPADSLAAPPNPAQKEIQLAKMEIQLFKMEIQFPKKEIQLSCRKF